MNFSRSLLSNGLRVIHVHMPVMKSVTVAVFVGVGSRYESDAQAGTAHLLEHMLFKGTARRPHAADISQTLDAVGGMMNASTDKELTVYWTKVAAEHLALAVDLLSDMIHHSRLAPADIRREKNVILEELNMLRDDTAEWAHTVVDELMWPEHSLGREVAGTERSVNALRRTDVTTMLRNYYGPNNAVIAFAGGADRDTALHLSHVHFKEWSSVVAPCPAPAPSDGGSGGSRVRFETRPIEQVHLCLAFPGLSRHDPDHWALELLCMLLGGGTSSRLFLELRERQGLAYDVHAYTDSLSDTGVTIVYAAADPERSSRVLEGILHEIKRLQRRRVRQDELRRVQEFYRGRMWLGLEDTHAVANWFGAQEMLQDEIVSPDEAVHRMAEVTADDIMRVARQYLDRTTMRLAAIGPGDHADLRSAVAALT